MPFTSRQEPHYIAILGPDGKVGWGVAYSQFNADEQVGFLNRAYELGNAERSKEDEGE